MIRTALIAVLAGAALAASAGGVWLAGTPSALAPEPAMLLVDLTASQGTGTSASARGVNSGVETNVVKFPSSWSTGYAWLPAGTPCSPNPVPAYSVTGMVIQLSPNGTYRRCA